MAGCLATLRALPASALHSKKNQLAYLFNSEWPPAISSSYVKFLGQGYSCLLDNFGKLTTADLRNPEHYKVLGQLTDIGKRVLDFAVGDKLGYALVIKETESSDLQTAVSIIDLAKPNAPTLIHQQELPKLSVANNLVCGDDYICVAGISDTNCVCVYKIAAQQSRDDDDTEENRKSAKRPLDLIKTFSPAGAVQKMVLEQRRLFVLAVENMKSTIYGVNLASSHTLLKEIATLDGEFTTMAAGGNLILAAGRAGNGLETVLVNLLPAPHMVCKQTLGNAQAVYDMVARKNDFLLLVERDQNLNLSGIAYNRSLSLTPLEEVTVTKFAGSPDTRSRIDVYSQYANVVTGGDSVYVLAQRGANWAKRPAFVSPALPISALAFWGNYLITAGSDLGLYDTVHPQRTHKVMGAKTETTVNAIVTAGSYLLCQTRDSLSLRKISRLDKVITSVKVFGQCMIYDDTASTAYVLDRKSGNTTVTPVHVYSNKLAGQRAFTLPGEYSSAARFESKFILGGTNDISLYKFDDCAELLGSRNLPNHVVRAVGATSEYLLAVIVDHDLKGQLLVVSPELSNGQLELISNLDLPQDACALAVAGNKVLVAGQSSEGQSLLTIIKFDDPLQPEIEKTIEVLADACTLAVQDKLVVIAGRGLQIVNL